MEVPRTRMVGLMIADGRFAVPVPGATAVSARPFKHYVLFGPSHLTTTRVQVMLARPFLLAFTPVFGFSSGEAAGADRVTIIGDTGAVSAATESGLQAAGAQVQRIAGNPQEIAQALNERLVSGTAFTEPKLAREILSEHV